MSLNRRQYLQTVAAAVVGGSTAGRAEPGPPLGIPGPYRGRVVGVTHSKSVRDGDYQAKPIREMLNRGMCELTGAADPIEAWRQFIAPDDVVGIKVNPVAQPHVCSSSQLLSGVLEALKAVGVKPGNVTVFERYRDNIQNSPYMSWVPRDVRIGYAGLAYEPIQQGIDGYDPECYVELPFTLPGHDLNSPAAIRSHAALFVSRDITKLINIPVLKTHNAAGVTLALKNLSHGLVNNVSRSHDGPDLRYTDFIPNVVNMPVIRQKTVLNILDGTKGLFHGGPGLTSYMVENFIWDHKTLYFATDPVALDVIGRRVLEEQRARKKLWPIADNKSDDVWKSPRRQPQYIEGAGRIGLGESDPAKIDFRPLKLA